MIFAFYVVPWLAFFAVPLVSALEYSLRSRPLGKPVDVRHAILHERTLNRISAR